MEERIGKVVNDSPERFTNCSMKMVDVDGIPHLCLFSIKEIPKGTELRFDKKVFQVIT